MKIRKRAAPEDVVQATKTHRGLNPLSMKPYSRRYHEILEKRLKLPVYESKEKFLRMVKQNQYTVLVGETGSGKTTQVSYPSFLSVVYTFL